MLKDQNLGIYQVAHVLPDPAIYTGIMAAWWRIDLWWFEGLITYICDIICRSNFGNATLWGWELHRLFLRFLQQPAEEKQRMLTASWRKDTNPQIVPASWQFLSYIWNEDSLRSNWTKSCWTCWLWQLFLPILGGSWSIMICCCTSWTQDSLNFGMIHHLGWI